jgi:hypothetical protein
MYILLQNYVFAQQWDPISEKSFHNTCNFIQNIVYQYNRPDDGYFGWPKHVANKKRQVVQNKKL